MLIIVIYIGVFEKKMKIIEF